MPCAVKSIQRALGCVALAIGLNLALAPIALASDPSAFVTEVLTPAGWELYGVWCGEEDEPASSTEIRTPEGWAHASTREEPRWGGYACSELVVPPEWLRGVALR